MRARDAAVSDVSLILKNAERAINAMIASRLSMMLNVIAVR